MKRLTQKQSAGYDLKALNGQYCNNYCDEQSATTCRDCAIYQAIQKLARYEDTGLTPEQVMELKERNTAKEPEEIQDAFGDGRLICPNCRNSVINYFNRSRPPRFCMICGQRLKFGE